MSTDNRHRPRLFLGVCKRHRVLRRQRQLSASRGTPKKGRSPRPGPGLQKARFSLASRRCPGRRPLRAVLIGAFPGRHRQGLWIHNRVPRLCLIRVANIQRQWELPIRRAALKVYRVARPVPGLFMCCPHQVRSRKCSNDARSKAVGRACRFELNPRKG